MTPAALKGSAALDTAQTRFTIPPQASARVPPEARGLARDEVRLMVAAPGRITHTRFRHLADHLSVGDLVVVNTSATIAAAVPGKRRRAGAGLVDTVVHFSSPAGNGRWIVELRDASRHRVHDGRAGERISLPHGVTLSLTAPWPHRPARQGSRLWLADVGVESGVMAYLKREGQPIAYDHIDGRWPLAAYQTVFAQHPGSAEMASAGRPFSARLVADLQSRGIGIAPVVLHTGVSSLEAGERPLPERYEVTAATAARINATRARGKRVIAAGTTVTRAVETVADEDGTVHAGTGLTELVISAQRPPRAIDGLITGWHEPQASHLLLLEAVAGSRLVAGAYAEALDPATGGYLWHEFGDSCLFLP